MMKKNLAVTGDVEGWMIPCLSPSLTYVSLASTFFTDRGYRKWRPLEEVNGAVTFLLRRQLEGKHLTEDILVV